MSPIEVESALKTHPAVVDAVVFSIPHRTLIEEVGAAVVSSDPALNEAALRDHAFQHLAPFKVPRRVVFIDAIPKEPAMGKVQRVGMAERLGLAGPGALAAEPEPPSTRTEKRLARMWDRLLGGAGPIGRDDDFFGLGGDSLMAVEMLADIDRTFRARIPDSVLLRSARLQDLARAIDDYDHSPPVSSLVPVQPNGPEPPLFWVHGGGGSVMGTATLALHLGPNNPFTPFNRRGSTARDRPTSGPRAWPRTTWS